MIEKNEYDNGLTVPHIVVDLRNTEDDATITMTKSEYLWFQSRGNTDDQIYHIGIVLNDEREAEDRLDQAIERFKHRMMTNNSHYGCY